MWTSASSILFLVTIWGTIHGVVLAETCSKELKCIPTRDESNKKIPIHPTNSTHPGNCNGHFGGFPSLEKKTQNLVVQHLETSMKFLLLSNRFDYWKTQRKGLHSLLMKYSDDTFDDAVKMLQHMAKRGGRISEGFGITMPANEIYTLTEMEALAKALDYEKNLASQTSGLIHLAVHGHSGESDRHLPDGEFAHFLSEEISSSHLNRVHDLASHVRNVEQGLTDVIMSGRDKALFLHLYDAEFLS